MVPEFDGGLLSADECAKLIRFAEPLRKAELRDTDPVNVFLERDSAPWLFDRLAVKFANYAPTVEQSHIMPVRILRYVPGDRIDWHTDYKPGSPRKLTALVALNTGYRGGELQIMGGDGQPVELPTRRAGDAVFFYGWMPHRVLPVTDGERLALAAWATGPDYV